jgi:hypothetical protein
MNKRCTYLHGFKAKVVVVEIFVVYDCRVEFFGMGHDGFVGPFGNHRTELSVFRVDVGIQVMNDLGKLFFCLLVKIRDGDTNSKSLFVLGILPCSKNSIVRMFCGHISSSLGSKVVKFNCCDTLLD